MKKSTLSLTILGSIALLLPSCNTVVGAGRDLRKLGETVETKAYHTKTGTAPGTYTPPGNYVPPTNQIPAQ